MSYLILVRHGESVWNKKNVFTGAVDIPLSKKGIKEALLTAKELKGLSIDIAFTSKLERAQETLLIILSQQKKIGVFIHESKKDKKDARYAHSMTGNEIPVYSSSALDERHYGKLQGINKDAARNEFGEKQVFVWRRSYAVRPPGGESLKDVYARAVPYYKKKIVPEFKKGNDVVISAHGNSLRAIIKYIEKISDKDIPYLELPTGKPFIYWYDKGTLVRKNMKLTLTRPIHWKEKK